MDVGLSGRRYHSGRVEEKVVHRHRNRMAQTRAVDGTFGSDHEPWIELIIESDMGAADHCLQRLAERPSRKLGGGGKGSAAKAGPAIESAPKAGNKT